MKRVFIGILAGTAALSLVACSNQLPAPAVEQKPLPTAQPVSATANPANPPEAPPQTAALTVGEITAIDGSTLTLQSRMQADALTVILTDTTQLFKYVVSDFASLPVGDSISLMGQQDGEVILASVVQVGGEAQAVGMTLAPARSAGVGGGGPQGADGGQGGPNGQPPSDEGGQPGQPPSGDTGNGQPPGEGTLQPGQDLGQQIRGTIEQVSGDTLTVKLEDGSTVQVKLAEGGQALLRVDATSADLVVGVQVAVAAADETATPLVATQIEIMPQMEMPTPP